jgi:hypothetical protein
MQNRKALAWLMVGLLVLAGCSSTPRVVETQPNPNAVSAATRALIEADPHFQLVARLAAQENKHPDWSKATQHTDSNYGFVVQIPLWFDEYNLQMVIVRISGDNIDVVVSSAKKEARDVMEIAVVDMASKTVSSARVASWSGDPSSSVGRLAIGTVSSQPASLDQLEVGQVNYQAQSIDELLKPVRAKNLNLSDVTQQSRPCGREEAILASASLTLLAAYQALGPLCGWGTLLWTPPCWGAISAYVAAAIAVGVAAGDLRNCYARHGL